MRNSITIEKLDINNNQRISTLESLGSSSIDLVRSNPFLRNLPTEDCENFTEYIERLGLAKDPNLPEDKLSAYKQKIDEALTESLDEWVKDKTWEEMVRLYLMLWKLL